MIVIIMKLFRVGVVAVLVGGQGLLAGRAISLPREFQFYFRWFSELSEPSKHQRFPSHEGNSESYHFRASKIITISHGGTRGFFDTSKLQLSGLPGVSIHMQASATQRELEKFPFRSQNSPGSEMALACGRFCLLSLRSRCSGVAPTHS